MDLPEGKLAYPSRAGDAPFKALERLLDIQKLPDKREVVREIKAQAAQKLDLLQKMHSDLLLKAQKIVEKVREDLRLHDIPVYGRKIRDKTYYLYSMADDEQNQFFSILEPDDYLAADPDAGFCGAFHLNGDSSWTLIESDD